MTPEEQNRQLVYIRSILGIPYRLNCADATKGLDCLTCARKIQQELFGNILPDINIEDEKPASFIKAVILGKHLANWYEVPEPVNGCVVELIRGQTPHHIGVYFHLPSLGVNGLVHCIKSGGVVYDPWNTLKAAGWRGFKYNVPNNP